MPEWYFFSLLFLLIIVIWIKLTYPKYFFDIFAASVSYSVACKIFNESGVIKKKVDLAIDLIYIISGGLFLYCLLTYFNLEPFELSGVKILLFSVLCLISIILFRVFCLKLISVIFHQEKLVDEFIFHFYLYNKTLGLLLIPFLLFIPYTEGVLQYIFLYISALTVLVVYIYRLLRIIIFLIKNEVFILYLILYLCILEILPFMVAVKYLLSLAQGF